VQLRSLASWRIPDRQSAFHGKQKVKPNDETAHMNSSFDRTNVIVKARHMYRAVKTMYNYVEAGMHITWKECCKVAIQDELSK
jgi:hypothetical protein